MLTLNTFEDVIQPPAVEMYMITCLSVACTACFSAAQFIEHAKTGQNQLKLAVWNQYQLFGHNIIIYWFARDVPLTNQRTTIWYEK